MVLLFQYIIVLCTKLLRLFLGSSVCSMAPAIRAVLNDIAHFIITITILIYFAISIIYTVRSVCLEFSNLGYSNFPSLLLFLCSRWSATIYQSHSHHSLFPITSENPIASYATSCLEKYNQGIFIMLEINKMVRMVNTTTTHNHNAYVQYSHHPN